MRLDFFDDEYKGYRGPWPPFPGMYPVHLRETGFVLAVAIWDPDVPKSELLDDLTRMEPDVSPLMLTRVNFGTPDEIAALLASAVGKGRSIAVDLSDTKIATRKAFSQAFSEAGITFDRTIGGYHRASGHAEESR